MHPALWQLLVECSPAEQVDGVTRFWRRARAAGEVLGLRQLAARCSYERPAVDRFILRPV